MMQLTIAQQARAAADDVVATRDDLLKRDHVLRVPDSAVFGRSADPTFCPTSVVLLILDSLASLDERLRKLEAPQEAPDA